MKSPYTFPHKSRKAMTDYLADHESYHPMNSWNGGFVLAWNIKVPFGFDTMGGRGDLMRNPGRDGAWRSYVADSDDLFWTCCENARRMYVDGEWTNYPGIEQGDWQFNVNGRSEGHLILDKAPGWLPAPRAWKASPMIWESRGSYEDWLANLSFAELKRFYRTIRVLDHDLRREAIKREMEFQYSFQRELWELEQDSLDSACAQLQEAARPDLYGGAP